MKKKLFFLILLIGIFLSFIKNTNAETIQFYEGDYAGDSYVTKYDPKTKTKYYQRSRFFREVGSHRVSYCVEPFAMFNENSKYQSVITPDNLTQEQIERINNLAYFGYLI